MEHIGDKTNWQTNLRDTWATLGIYEKFEYLISLIVSFVIGVIIIIALVRLVKNVFELLVFNALDPLQFTVFQTIFGMILTLFIAMEFQHSIRNVLQRRGHIIQVQSVILIAMLAIARKFIVIDTKATSAESLAALALIALSLGAVYWLLKTKQKA